MNHNTYLFLLILLKVGNCQPDQSERWGYGLLSSFGVSLIGFVISAIIILMKKYSKEISTTNVTKVLIGFAIGALLGDSFIHLIPEAFNTSEEDHGHRRILEDEANLIGNDSDDSQGENNEKRYLSSLTLICGVLSFFLIEKFMIFLEGLGQSSVVPVTNDNLNDPEQGASPVLNQNSSSDNEIEKIKEKQEQHYQHVCTCSVSQQLFSIASWKHKPTLGYLNLVGDFLHNIMDGLAIGVLFASSQENDFRNTTATMIAIVVHEIAQEIGDTSILLENKFTNLQALISNGIVNTSALIGCFIGLGIGSIDNQNYVYAFVAGNFIYISCVDMMPEVLRESNFKITFLQFIGILTSMAIMYGLAIFEHSSE